MHLNPPITMAKPLPTSHLNRNPSPGDIVWRFPWPGPSLETACGYSTGPFWMLDDLSVEALEPDESCSRCLSDARTFDPISTDP